MGTQTSFAAENGESYLETIERHFSLARGSGTFRLSPRDWALANSWNDSGIPLEAVLRGIDQAFERWRRTRQSTPINSLAYCANSVMAEARALANRAPISSGSGSAFSIEQIRGYLARNAAILREKGQEGFASRLGEFEAEPFGDLEGLETQLCGLESEIISSLEASASAADREEILRLLERELKPYRGKMTADQIAMLEKQFRERKMLERAGLPRLSLFYLPEDSSTSREIVA